MTSTVIAAALGLCLLGSAGPLPAANPQPRPQEEPGSVSSSELKIKEVLELLGKKDPALLDKIIKFLSEPDPSVRSQTVQGIITTFPDRAFDVLNTLITTGDEYQREAAEYGIGMVNDPRVLAVLLSRVVAGKPLQRGVVGGLQMHLRETVVLTNNRVLSPSGDPPSSLDPYTRTVEHFSRLAVPGQRPTGPFYDDFMERIADYRSCSSRMAAVVAQQTNEATKSALAAFFKSNRFWLGRPPTEHCPAIEYEFRMVNMATRTPKEKVFTLAVGPVEGGVLRYLHRMSVFSRAIQLTLPLDSLFVEAERCSVQYESSKENRATLSYSLPQRRGIVAGMGLLNTSYWLGRIVDPERSVVTIDTTRMVPLSEDVFRGATRVARFEYSDFVKANDGWVPQRVTAVLDELSNMKETQLSYDFRFSWHDIGLWQFRSGSTSQLAGDGQSVLRATAEIGSFQVSGSKKSQTPKKPQNLKKPQSRPKSVPGGATSKPKK